MNFFTFISSSYQTNAIITAQSVNQNLIRTSTPVNVKDQFNINGNRDRSNNYMLDGTDNNDPFLNNSALNQVGITGAPASLLPIDDGLKREAEIFAGTVFSEQARALRYIFFAERAAFAESAAGRPQSVNAEQPRQMLLLMQDWPLRERLVNQAATPMAASEP